MDANDFEHLGICLEDLAWIEQQILDLSCALNLIDSRHLDRYQQKIRLVLLAAICKGKNVQVVKIGRDEVSLPPATEKGGGQ